MNWKIFMVQRKWENFAQHFADQLNCSSSTIAIDDINQVFDQYRQIHAALQECMSDWQSKHSPLATLCSQDGTFHIQSMCAPATTPNKTTTTTTTAATTLSQSTNRKFQLDEKNRVFKYDGRKKRVENVEKEETKEERLKRMEKKRKEREEKV